MEVLRPADAAGFLELAGPLLVHEARHSLLLGIAGTLVSRPEVYPRFHLWVATDDGRPVAAALQTEPYNLVLADPAGEEALQSLLDAVHEDRRALPGLSANLPHAEVAATRWASLTGTRPERAVALGVLELTAVWDVPRPAGTARAATRFDGERLDGWMVAFAYEALPDPAEEVDALRTRMRERLEPGDDAGNWVWDLDGTVTSVAAFGGPTPTGIRIGPVYTPPEHRRHGYATALVADLSRFLLERGRRACYLYTDLANPTSNGVYERIGYERVADAAVFRFREA